MKDRRAGSAEEAINIASDPTLSYDVTSSGPLIHQQNNKGVYLDDCRLRLSAISSISVLFAS
jgi:hypothetical protein